MSAPYEQQPYGQSYGAATGPGGPSAVAPAGPAPAPVRRAVLAAYVIAALSIVGIVVSIATYSPSASTSGNGALSDSAQRGLATVAAVVGGIVGAVVWALFARFTSRGRNWARIVLIVLSALGILGGLYGISRLRASSVLSAVELVLEVVVLVGLVVRPAAEWFAALKAQRTGYGYGAPGAQGGPQDPGYPPVPPVQ